MKLRNKKTGTIGELHFEPDKEYHFTVVTEDPSDVMIYKTLGEVIKDWADFIVHVPAEPLIKDEKIRKAVRAWAEVNDLCGATYSERPNGCAFIFVHADGDKTVTCFRSTWLGLEKGSSYTITELCGEDGKWD